MNDKRFAKESLPKEAKVMHVKRNFKEIADNLSKKAEIERTGKR